MHILYVLPLLKLWIRIVWYCMVMTHRQEKVVELLEEGATPTEAMRQAGYSEASIRLPQRVTRSKKVRTELEKALNKHTITKERLIAKLDAALDAEKLIVMGKDTDDSFIDRIPDYAIQLKAVDMLLKLLPKDTDKKQEDTPQFDNEMIKDLLANGNLVELQRVLLSKDTNQA